MAASIVQVRNPHALRNPDLVALLERAVAAQPNVARGGLQTIAEDLYAAITRQDQFFFLAAEDGQLTGLAMGLLPQSGMIPYPLVTMTYNEGSRDSFRGLLDKVLDFVQEAGYTKVWDFNDTGHSAEVLGRLARSSRGEVKQIGTIVEFHIK